jgi:Tol biopolymer transport system component/DNA-binding winged helix-turn-helix (wHTH) protein
VASHPIQTVSTIRFGVFEVDLRSRELRKNGTPLRLQGKPFQLLVELLRRPGEVLTREELRRQLWSDGIFVDFDEGLNSTVKRLRAVLGDSSQSPIYIETVSGSGYRFIAPVSQEVCETESLPALALVPKSNDGSTTQLDSRRGAQRWPSPASVLLAVFSVFLVAGAALVLVKYLTRTPEAVAVVPFTSFAGLESYPSFSPDGNQMAFAWDGGDPRSGVDLYLKQLGNETPRRLTYHPSRYSVPAWSPDGQSIAFSRMDPAGSGIYMVPALGGPERKLADTAEMYWIYGMLSWSQDGKWIAYADTKIPRAAPIPTQIHLLNIETLENRVLPHPAQECEASWVPSFSPDGKHLATACVVSIGVQRIYVQPALGGKAQQVVRLQGDFRGMTWSADSKSLIYSLDRWLWRIPSSGGTPEKLLFASDAFQPAVARTGNRLAFSQQTYSSYIWGLDLATAISALHPPVRLISSSRGQENPRISPDGKFVAFDSWRSGAPEVWLSNADGSNPVQLTSFMGPLTGTPRWSPDGQWLVFDSRATGQSGLYIVNRQGGPSRQVATGSLSASEPFWSHNGKWIYFSGERGGGIWKVQASGGSPVRLTQDNGLAQEAPNGNRVYYAKYAPGAVELWSVSADGGDQRRIVGMPTLALADEWVPATDGIYFIQANAAQARLSYFEFRSGRIHNLVTLHGLVNDWGSGPSLTSDGHTLVYAENDLVSGDIMLVQNFR